MASETIIDSMDLRMRELLNEVKLKHSPSFTKLVDDVVSALRDSIDQIPQDLQVRLCTIHSFRFFTLLHFGAMNQWIMSERNTKNTTTYGESNVYIMHICMYIADCCCV